MDKEQAVQRMFSSAALRYDLNNTILSLGRHHSWKRYVISQTCAGKGGKVLDVCTGTADIAMLLARKIGPSGHVMAVDLNLEMLELGKRKVREYGLECRISCSLGNAESLQFGDNKFDAATVGFGVRNVANLKKAFSELFRVTRSGGRVVCLEFSQPSGRVFKYLYDLYSFTLLPAIGTIISRDNTGIYKYLPDSIRRFPSPEALRQIMLEIGFSKVYYVPLSGGIVVVHVGIK